ncbi:MAG: molybdate ABC transporter substrate-binding protein, partial [Sinobacteraceae bacterium]|nr:molybdate ABC transporter substrate-binding protein [Nevskiaceae bacterium]
IAGDAAGPAAVLQAGLGVPGSRFTYAQGRLVLWSRDPGRVDAEGAVLRRSDWARLAVANPALAPYGKAAMETLDRLGLRASVQGRMVQGENIAQTYQFVASGNAQLGFVAMSQVMSDDRIKQGSAWVVPRQWHSPITQDAVLLQRGRDNAAAIALLEYLRSESARVVMRGFGYEFSSEGS